MRGLFHFGPSIAVWASDMAIPDENNVTDNGQHDSNSVTESSTDSYSAPPELQPSDYVEIGLLLCMVVVGGPLNVISLLRALRMNFVDVFRCCYRAIRTRCGPGGDTRHPRGAMEICQRRLTLRFHLTVANLLVLWVYGISEICWLSTYSWRGGDVLCRFVRFVHAFCFYATSNVVAAIGIDRLYVTVYVDRPKLRPAIGRPKIQNSICWLASIAWILAFVSSVPQLFIWGTFQPFPGRDWSQCVTVWTVKKYYDMLASNETESQHAELNYQEKLYDGLHLALVFWIPAIFITVSYASILTRFNWNIRKRSRQQPRLSLSVSPKSQTLQRDSPVAPGHYDTSASVTTIGKSPGTTKTASVDLLDGGSCRNLLTNSPIDCSRARQASPKTFSMFRTSRFGFRRRRHTDFALATSAIGLDQTEATARVDDELSSVYSTVVQSTELLQCQRRSTINQSASHSFAVITLTRARRRTVRKTVWILLAYFLFWSPYNVLALYRYFYPHFEHSYLEIMYNLIVLNAVVNPLIYGI